MFRPPPPPRVGTTQRKAEVDECLHFNATLSPEQKAIVEFMRDGPRSTGQSGHWLRFAQAASRRDRYDMDRDIKLYFCVANSAMDAFIAAWESKRYDDSSRPWTLIRHYDRDQPIVGWLGPGRGGGRITGAQRIPSSPATFITPPFPGYVSGHSAVSGACATILERFTGSDQFGDEEVRLAGSETERGYACAAMQSVQGRAPVAAAENCRVTLPLPTFSAVAEMAGISRVMGGYHIQADNVAGLHLGRTVAAHLWPKCQAYFDGTARGSSAR